VGAGWGGGVWCVVGGRGDVLGVTGAMILCGGRGSFFGGFGNFVCLWGGASRVGLVLFRGCVCFGGGGSSWRGWSGWGSERGSLS